MQVFLFYKIQSRKRKLSLHQCLQPRWIRPQFLQSTMELHQTPSHGSTTKLSPRHSWIGAHKPFLHGVTLKNGVNVDSFWLICLQNCTVKIIEKILTQRVQREISGTTDSNQTGFLRGRSISETFIFVLKLYNVVSRKKSLHLSSSWTSQRLLTWLTGKACRQF